MNKNFIFFLIFGLVTSRVLAGEGFRTYRVSKEVPEGAAREDVQMPGVLAKKSLEVDGPVGAMGVPEHWRVVEPKPMQLRRFELAGGGEVSVASFPGRTGGLLQNINRWRGQLGLGPVEEAQLASLGCVEPVVIEGKGFEVVRLLNEATQRALVVAIHFDGEQSWFFKLEGPQAVVNQEEFLFLKDWLPRFYQP